MNPCLFLLLAQDSAATPPDPLNAVGTILMVVSVSFVTVLTFWCFKRVLRPPFKPAKQVEDFHSA